MLLLDVSGDDTQADLCHLFKFGVAGAARGAVPGLQPVQQVHHPFKDLQHNEDNCQQRTKQKRLDLFPHLGHNIKPFRILNTA